MLPFTADVLFASFEQYNRAFWPLPAVLAALGLAAVLLALRPGRATARVIVAVLAAAWLWTGVHFHLVYFAAVDFAAPAYGALLIGEGLLLAWAAVRRPPDTVRFARDVPGWAGLGLALLGLAVLPLADGLAAGWTSVRLVGVAPGPTALLTLGLLLLVAGRAPLHLAVIPLLWTLIGGTIAWILWIPQDLVLAPAAFIAFGLLVWKNRRTRAACASNVLPAQHPEVTPTLKSGQQASQP